MCIFVVSIYAFLLLYLVDVVGCLVGPPHTFSWWTESTLCISYLPCHRASNVNYVKDHFAWIKSIRSFCHNTFNTPFSRNSGSVRFLQFSAACNFKFMNKYVRCMTIHINIINRTHIEGITAPNLNFMPTASSSRSSSTGCGELEKFHWMGSALLQRLYATNPVSRESLLGETV